ncbi:hypothetical protein TNCV_4614881 [Trichonephila clavipes]|nr:hypothetical protein TNCV_4614881 [Trichonephila clavipes]
MMIPAYNKKRCAAFLSRRESITGGRLTSFRKKADVQRVRHAHALRGMEVHTSQLLGVLLRKKSSDVKSVDHGSHRTLPSCPIQRPGYAISSQSRTGAQKCVGSPS